MVMIDTALIASCQGKVCMINHLLVCSRLRASNLVSSCLSLGSLLQIETFVDNQWTI